MKQIKELIHSPFILRCACGAHESMHSRERLGVCLSPIYNEQLNAIFCERCQNPAFVSLVDPKKLTKGSDEERAMLAHYFVLHSEQNFIDQLAQLKRQAEEDQEKQYTLLKDFVVPEEPSEEPPSET